MRPLIAIVGPTATGKSDAAIALARRFDGEIINADALQFYRGMDIGTAKLPENERGGITHHLVDIMDIDGEASVATFQQQAREKIAEIQERGRLPILVGGSGLYVRAVIDDLEFPPTDPVIRGRLEDEASTEGVTGMRARLALADPVSAARDLDERRLIRALEVHELTGRPFSSYMPRRNYRQPTLQLGLDIERGRLHARVAERVHIMCDSGLLAEVESLAQRGLRETRTASRAIGYSQFLQVLEGTSTIEQAIESTTVATRQFARRQLTWFRADPRVRWFDAAEPDLRGMLATAVQEFEASGGT